MRQTRKKHYSTSRVVTELDQWIVRRALISTIWFMKLTIRLETTSLAKVVVICATIALVVLAAAEALHGFR